jgi:hypothetical protein
MFFLGVGKSATIRAIASWAEKILRKSGDHPNRPRVLICAPTGKAASLISKHIFTCSACALEDFLESAVCVIPQLYCSTIVLRNNTIAE